MLGGRVRSGRSFDEAVARAVKETAWGDWGDGVAGGPYGGTWAGNNVDASNALQLLAVYGCNRFICEGISTLPIDVFRALPGGDRVEVPRPAWLDRPTADLDRISWLTQVLTSLLLAGNAYLRKVYAGDGTGLSELVPMDPATIRVSREQGRKVYRRNGAPLDPASILHIPAVMFPGSDVGLSPVEASRQAIGGGMAVEEFAGRFFGQGANLGGVIEDPGEVNPDRAGAMARGWARLHSGNRRAHLPGVLQGGATWKPTGVTNEQSQFLQTRQFTMAEIASHMFLIDPSEFGFNGERGSAVTYQNLEQRNARKVQVTFLPWLVRLEAAFSSLLPQPRFVKFNVAGLLRGDTKTRMETYQLASTINTAAAMVGMGPIMTTREMRALEDMPPTDVVLTPVPATAPPTQSQNAAPTEDAPPVNNAPISDELRRMIDEAKAPRRLHVVRDDDGRIVSLAQEPADAPRNRQLDLVRDHHGLLIGLEEVGRNGSS